MKKILIALMLLGGMVQAQTFNFSCDDCDFTILNVESPSDIQDGTVGIFNDPLPAQQNRYRIYNHTAPNVIVRLDGFGLTNTIPRGGYARLSLNSGELYYIYKSECEEGEGFVWNGNEFIPNEPSEITSDCLDGNPDHGSTQAQVDRYADGSGATMIDPDWVLAWVAWDEDSGNYRLHFNTDGVPDQFSVEDFTIQLQGNTEQTFTVSEEIINNTEFVSSVEAGSKINVVWRLRDNCTQNDDGENVTVRIIEEAIVTHPLRTDFKNNLGRWGRNAQGNFVANQAHGRYIVGEFTNKPYRVIVKSSSTTVNFTPEYHYPDESSYFHQINGVWFFALDMANDVYEPLANTNSAAIEIDNLVGGDPTRLQDDFWNFHGPYELDVRMHPNECNDILITGYSPSAYGGLEYRYIWEGNGGTDHDWYYNDGYEDLDHIISSPGARKDATHLRIQVRTKLDTPNGSPRSEGFGWNTIVGNDSNNQLAHANVGEERFEVLPSLNTAYRLPHHAWEIGNEQDPHGQTMDIYINPNNTNLEVFVANPVTDPRPNAGITITHFTSPLTVTQPYGTDFRYQFRAWSPVLNRWIYASDDNDRPNLSDNSSYWRTKGYMIVPAGTEVQVRIRSRGQCTTSWQGN